MAIRRPARTKMDCRVAPFWLRVLLRQKPSQHILVLALVASRLALAMTR
jgi:hypothetical protein